MQGKCIVQLCFGQSKVTKHAVAAKYIFIVCVDSVQ